MRVKLRFIWWRAWYHRNDVIFGKGDTSIENSTRYLQNYRVSLQGLKKETIVIGRKGKGIQAVKTSNEGRQSIILEPSVVCWEKPSVGWGKNNIDVSFLGEKQSGTWGAVHRDHNAAILRSAWGLIPH
jgi:hypothetical protein